jgi:hypothetical protein
MTNGCYTFEGGVDEVDFSSRGNDYSKDTAREILSKFKKKGWDLYRTVRVKTEEGKKKIVTLGPAEELMMGQWYVPVPACENPANYLSLTKKIEEVQKKHGSDVPMIFINSDKRPLRVISLGDVGVKVYAPTENYLSYPSFKNSLDRIVETF